MYICISCLCLLLISCHLLFSPLISVIIIAVWIWVYDLVCLAIIDVLKVCYLRFMGVNMDVLPDEDLSESDQAHEVGSMRPSMRESRTTSKSMKGGGVVDALIAAHDDDDVDLNPRASASLQQLHNWHESKSGRAPSQYSFSRTGGGDLASASMSFRGSSMRLHRSRATSDAPSASTTSVVPSAQSYSAANTIMGRSLLSAASSLRPNTPAHAAKSFSHRR